MQEPGGLATLGDAGAAAWKGRLERIFTEVREGAARRMGEENRFVLPSPDETTVFVTGPDWTGFPIRVSECLGRERALRLLDLSDERVDGGGRGLQEEYLEWRVSRKNGRIERVELTSELADYWCVLAAHDPAQLLETVASFAGEATVDSEAIFGKSEREVRRASAREREHAFTRQMLGPRGRSPFNNGVRAICCMVQETNSLKALIALATAATNCRVIQDTVGKELRCLTCLEAIPLVKEAQLGRSSDPVLVERLGRLAYEGRRVTFDDPLGIYIQGAEHTRLQTPGGEEIPAEWFTFSRGLGAEDASDGRARFQRAILEVPAGEGFAVGDLVDVATEQPIRHGGQIADLVRLVLLLRVSPADLIDVDRESPVTLEPESEDNQGCAQVRVYERRALAGAR